MTGSPTPAERAALRVAHAVPIESRNPGYSLLDQVVFALGSAGLLQVPETAAELERLRKLFAEAMSDERLAEISDSIPTVYAAPWTVHPDMVDDCWRVRYATDNPLAGLVAEVPDYGAHLAEFIATARAAVPELLDEVVRLRSAAPAEVTIYRAVYESFVFGLYTTAAAAREHCETHERRDQPTATFDWIEDEEDGVAELVATVGGEEKPTGYVVTALEVASAYDPDGDE